VAVVEESAAIRGAFVVRLDAFGDPRGRFAETYRRSWFLSGREMVQQNCSTKQAGAVVGLHYHLKQADYWYVPAGTARVVLHDLRVGSPTEGSTEVREMGGTEDVGLYVPPGVAHGFAALSDLVLLYLVDSYYDGSDEHGLAFDDPELAIDWGVGEPIVSGRDRANPRRADIPAGLLPSFG
jgi:dTDP-4-dehydrorhamnose 3,5-epimerase